MVIYVLLVLQVKSGNSVQPAHYVVRNICTFSRSQNSPPEGNGVHFMFADVSRPVFFEESESADHFLKKGAQNAHFGPFLVHSWAKLKRLCCLT